MTQLTENEIKMIHKFEKYVYEHKVSNEFLVKIIELSGSFLNIQTISDYSRNNKISYNAAKKFRNVLEMFNIKWVIDND